MRDVLERSISSQLWKIAISAVVYGTLVIICLGGVVWGAQALIPPAFPIRWTSELPFLEFPIDLLFYNLFFPLALRLINPSKQITASFGWWFCLSAAWLRLTDFLCGDGSATERVQGQKHNGRFVHAPGSDQVRISPGQPAFIEVHDGSSTEPKHFTTVYLPPHFRLRIALFMLGVWLFAAIAGCSLALGPLLLGRVFLSSIIPASVTLNDIYAFSTGASIICTISYWRVLIRKLQLRASTRYLTLFYVYATCLLVIPALLSLTVHCYIVVPLHTFYAASAKSGPTIFLAQDWTLGLLYLKLCLRLILSRSPSRVANALRATVRNGYFHPSVSLLTRGFIIPSLVSLALILTVPLALGRLGCATVFQHVPTQLVYRYSYPSVLAALGFLVLNWYAFQALRRYRRRIRDEVYLIGERLHNYGERETPRVNKGKERARPAEDEQQKSEMIQSLETKIRARRQSQERLFEAEGIDDNTERDVPRRYAGLGDYDLDDLLGMHTF